MSEIEEGGQVVTPVGNIAEVTEEREGNAVKTETGGGRNIIVEHGKHDLVKVDQPIRVRVSRECYAESLVALAEEAGFEVGGVFYKNDIEFDDNPWPQYVYLKPEKMKVKCVYWDDHDLTYRDDLPQIGAWLEANAESEDGGCPDPRCNDGIIDDGPFPYPCPNPNCTDESEDYDDPKPEKLQRVHWRSTPGEVRDYIHDLQSELQDCWENQKEYKNDVAELQEELQDVREELFHKESYIQRLRERLNNARGALRSNQERIEEAREYIKKTHCELTRFERKLLKILSPDSDEVDAQED